MSEVLFLIRVQVSELDLRGVDSYFRDTRERLSAVDGALGQTLWRLSGAHDDMLVIQEYRDVESTERGLEALAGTKLLAESQSADYNPADLMRIVVHGRVGCRPSQTANPSYLSMSIRISDPGYEAELLEDVSHIFQELQLIPGFLGAMYGNRDGLDEEVIGLVTWGSPEAFSQSLPPKQRKYEVRLYERVY